MKIARPQPIETPEQRAKRRAELKAAIIAYKQRWQHHPVAIGTPPTQLANPPLRPADDGRWGQYLDWCERQKATAAKFNASNPGDAR